MTKDVPVGVVGVGLMGEAFAGRLLVGGHKVVGFDRDASRMGKLAALGATPATSVAEMARTCHPIILAVFDADQVEEVVARDIVPVLAPGERRPTIICTSTCDPDRVAALGARAAECGLPFVECPVSGTSEQVRRGEGVGLVGGDPDAAAAVAAALDAILPKRFHIGRIGDGGRAKLAVNLILGLNRLALAEGLVFAERLGLSPETFLNVARGSAAYSQVMDTKGPKMVAGDFAPEGRVRQTLKDARLMLEQAETLGQTLPLLSVNAEILDACMRHGQADWDNSSVIEEIRRRRSPADATDPSAAPLAGPARKT